jgi:hypothetical protein
MHSNHAAFLHFRDVLRSVAPLPEGHQIPVLEIELLHALGRASESERRSRVLQRELERLRTDGPHACHADLEHQLAEARRELARSKADGQAQLRAMRLEVLSMEADCLALDEVCRSLLVTIEQAACSELAAPGDRAPKARVSA